MVEAAEAWAACRTLFEEVQLPFHLPGCAEFRGYLAGWEDFEARELRFWDAVWDAREERRSDPMCFWALEGKLSPSALRRAEELGLVPDEEPEEEAETSLQLLAWRILDDTMADWRKVPIGEEREFFRTEAKLLNQVARCVRVLERVDKLGATEVADAVLGRRFGRRTWRRRRLRAPTMHLEALSQVLCGVPISGEGWHIPSRFLKLTYRKIINTFGASAVHYSAVLASGALQTLVRRAGAAPRDSEADAGMEIVQFLSTTVEAGPRAGRTLIELLCAGEYAHFRREAARFLQDLKGDAEGAGARRYEYRRTGRPGRRRKAARDHDGDGTVRRGEAALLPGWRRGPVLAFCRRVLADREKAKAQEQMVLRHCNLGPDPDGALSGSDASEIAPRKKKGVKRIIVRRRAKRKGPSNELSARASKQQKIAEPRRVLTGNDLLG